MYKFLIVLVLSLSLLTSPTFALGPAIVIHGESIIIEGVAGGTATIFDHPEYGVMIIIHGVDFTNFSPNSLGPAIVIHGVAFGPLTVTDDYAFGPMIVDQGNNLGPAIVIHG